MVLGRAGAVRLTIAVVMRDAGGLHRLASGGLPGVTIAGDGVSGRALAGCDATAPQGGLAVQGVRDGEGWEEPVRGRGRRAEGEASAGAAVGAAARIDRPDTGGGAAERREAEAQGAALLGPACGLGRARRGGEVVGAPVEQRGETKDPASARRGPPAGEQRGDSRRAVVAGGGEREGGGVGGGGGLGGG